MWCLSRVEWISWLERKTNEEVLRTARKKNVRSLIRIEKALENG